MSVRMEAEEYTTGGTYATMGEAIDIWRKKEENAAVQGQCEDSSTNVIGS